jgi:CBS domain-containing protein
MTVDNFCIRTVDTAQADESVWTVAERMHQRSVGELVVVNDSNEPIGIITDRDLVERAMVKRLDADNTPVDKIMTKLPRLIFEGSTVEFALTAMRDGPFRRLPLVDHEGKLSGLVCLDDLMMKSARELALIGQIVKSETPCGIAEEVLVDAD